MVRVVGIEAVIQVVTVDVRGQRDIIEGEENRLQDRTSRDTAGKFDRIGPGAVNRQCLEPVVHNRT